MAQTTWARCTSVSCFLEPTGIAARKSKDSYNPTLSLSDSPRPLLLLNSHWCHGVNRFCFRLHWERFSLPATHVYIWVCAYICAHAHTWVCRWREKYFKDYKVLPKYKVHLLRFPWKLEAQTIFRDQLLSYILELALLDWEKLNLLCSCLVSNNRNWLWLTFAKRELTGRIWSSSWTRGRG